MGQFASEWGTWKTGRGCRNAASLLNSAEDWDAGFGFILVEQTQGRSPLDQHAQSWEGQEKGSDLPPEIALSLGLTALKPFAVEE